MPGTTYVLISVVNLVCNRWRKRGNTVHGSTVALEFVNQVGDTDSVASLEPIFANLLARFGFKSYAFGRVAAAARRDHGGEIWTLSSHGWVDHWTKQRYAKVEPTVWYWRAFPSHTVVTWSEIRRRCCGPRPHLMDEARDFGLREGIAVGLRMQRGDFASAAIGTEASEVSDIDIAAVGFASLVCVSKFARLVESEKRSRVVLTGRQRECLTWAAQGKTDWEISEILDLSRRTVQEHLGRCIAKLQAMNRAHAIAIGLMDNHISP